MRDQVQTFETEDDAFGWLFDTVDDPFIDNTRLAYADRVQVRAYNEKAREGCCGSADYKVKIGERFAWIGCNYGH